ncbi:hypothetical protein RJ639_011786 [Escallonia herrerae]|uniref:Mitochondrial transcription termination factor n=1 Tax=Escallonia herrerae TaxID=1293975 RepID=A0AA88VN11_9ASTE|nr:hypothetical protein RJ639_011786 [Escallonia herrerae]
MVFKPRSLIQFRLFWSNLISSPKTLVSNPRLLCASASARTSDCETLDEVDKEQPKAQADVLKSWGCTDTEISTIFKRQPSLRRNNPVILESKLNSLSSLGLGSSDLVKILNCRPRFLNRKLEKSWDERLLYLEGLFGSRELLLRAIVRNPSLLTYNIQDKIKPIVELYYEMGVGSRDLGMMLMSRPTLIPRTTLDDEKLECIRKTRVSQGSKMYKYVISLIAISRMETIREKVANFEKFGLFEDEILGLFGRSPLVLTLSIDKVQRNMTFLLGTLKLPASTAVHYPFLLFSNLETWLKPRMLLAGKIHDMGLYPQIKGSAVVKALRMAEKRFIEAHIKCHPDHIAQELMAYYTSAKGVKRLAESSRKNLHVGFPF